jgi:hypothetical protein
LGAEDGYWGLFLRMAAAKEASWLLGILYGRGEIECNVLVQSEMCVNRSMSNGISFV